MERSGRFASTSQTRIFRSGHGRDTTLLEARIPVSNLSKIFLASGSACRFQPSSFDLLVDSEFHPRRYTMRYMMFIKHTEDYRMEEVPQSLFAAMGEFVGEAMKTGQIVDTAGLEPTAKGKKVRLAG